MSMKRMCEYCKNEIKELEQWYIIKQKGSDKEYDMCKDCEMYLTEVKL